MSDIIAIHGREILDSRGNPTVEVEVMLDDGSAASASVPSGASTGIHEAIELRDNDETRYLGRGVLKAVTHINEEIADSITGIDALEQRILDQYLIELDGSENKSRLGANAILAVSLAVAKAAASSLNLPLYRYIGGINSYLLPTPMMNIINGGSHADNDIDIQEFMIMPVSATNIKDAVRMGAEIFHHLKFLLKNQGLNTNIGDEGGFAPSFKSADQACDFILQAIEKAGYKAKEDVYLAIDCAANEFYDGKIYHLKGLEKKFTSDQLIDYYKSLVKNYPIISIEDAMAEDDHAGWSLISKELGQKIQLVGDDLFVTNKKMLSHGIKNNLANAILIKPNQIGTLSETLDTIELAQKSGYNTIISHRSGETEDNSIAHIAVATGAGQIKTGSLSRTDRVAKYNELIRIEEFLSTAGEFAGSRSLSKFIC